MQNRDAIVSKLRSCSSSWRVSSPTEFEEGYGAAGERANTRRRRREATLALCSVDIFSTHPQSSKHELQAK